MKRTKILIGGFLVAIIAPALGINANADHSTGKIIAAVCINLVGVALLLLGIYTSPDKPRK